MKFSDLFVYLKSVNYFLIILVNQKNILVYLKIAKVHETPQRSILKVYCSAISNIYIYMYIIYIYTYTFKLYQSEIKLQTKVQITQQHNKSKSKTT